ncbi:MAG: hypothetical protein SX243_15970 [Acidobacteriota bacterium]|nr:hypothetical protein [Acidobacteriota bacterium]
MSVSRLLRFQLRCLYTPQLDVGPLRRLSHYLAATALAPRLILRFYRWVRTMRTETIVPWDGPERCCVVLLSYRRPANIPLLVESFLRCDFVGQVVVSNNNPEVDLSGPLAVFDDPRLELIQQPKATKQGIRFALAQRHAGRFDFFFSPDDDRFLLPSQLRQLFAALVAEPEVPHGIEGEVRVQRGDWEGYPFRVGSVDNGRADHLTGYYAFTRLHLRRALETFEKLGWKELDKVGNGEDIVLSFAGDDRPRIHDLGKILECESWSLAGVATWMTHDDFFEQRKDLHDRLQERRTSYAAQLR